jgi:hypothetical protein
MSSNFILFSEDDLDALAVTLFTKDVIVFGKNNEIVYVNIPMELYTAVEILITIRPLVGVSALNPYLFAKIGTLKQYRNCRRYYKYAAVSCGAEYPDRLSSQFQRRSICTQANVGHSTSSLNKTKRCISFLADDA